MNRRQNKTTNTKTPRIILLKILYGDDFMDYIKDDFGVENFLKDILKGGDEKCYFLENNPKVKEFSANWFIVVDYYKSKFGKNIRDKDAIERLSNIMGFKSLPKIYDFRCRLFKADFSIDNEFKQELTENLSVLKKISKKILVDKKKINNYFIKNKDW